MEGFKNESKLEINEDFSSKIELHFFRHDDKAKAGEGMTDNQVQLTEKGRLNAASTATEDNMDQSVAFGSPRLRTQETALLHMAGQNFTEEELRNGEYTLDALMEKVGPGKIAVDEDLDFFMGTDSKFVNAAIEQFGNGTFLKFVVENSDALAEEVGDKTAYTYSRTSAQVARIIKKYLTIAPRFEKLVKEKPDKYKNVMKRFMGTHQTVAESFLAKIIEISKGVETRDHFVALLGNSGFGFSEGFECDVLTLDNGEVKLHIKFTKPGKDGEEDFVFDQEIETSLIDKIIGEVGE